MSYEIKKKKKLYIFNFKLYANNEAKVKINVKILYMLIFCFFGYSLYENKRRDLQFSLNTQ